MIAPPRTLTARAAIGVAVLATVGVAAFSVVLAAVIDLRDAAAHARHAQHVIVDVADVQRLAVDLETGQRGYALTGEPLFLAPWRAARRSLPSRLADLQRDVAGSPAERARVVALRRAVTAYLHDYSEPLVALMGRDPQAARSIVETGRGKELMDALRVRFGAIMTDEHLRSDANGAHASAAGRRALVVGVVGILGSLLLGLAFALYLWRRILHPVRRVGAAAKALAHGNFSTRVDETGAGEIADLAVAFNFMADSLERSLDQLENQNAELEGQQEELGLAVAQLEDEKQRIESFFLFGELIAGETSLEQLARTVLDEIADFAGAEAGAVFLAGDERDSFAPAAVRGIDPRELPQRVVAGIGVAGRAVREHRVLRVLHEGKLRLQVFGTVVRLREEMHVPLVHADRSVGVLTLARIGDEPLADEKVAAVRHLAAQAAAALSNALAHEATRRQASQLRAVLDSTRDLIRMVDANGELMFENRAAAEFSAAHVGMSSLHMHEFAAAAASATTDPGAFMEMYERIDADPEYEGTDEYSFVEPHVSFVRYTAPVRDADGDVIGRIFVLRDVTSERDAERLKDEFVQLVSHELRTPLTSIVGYVETLLAGEVGELDETQRRFLRVVERNSGRLLRLVGDLLFLGRVGPGGVDVALERADLHAVAAECVEAAQPTAAERGVELELVADGPVPISADPRRLAQVIDNLLTNAVKFSDPGKRVVVTISRARGRARLQVRDEGIGIARGEIGRVFERFYRTAAASSRAVQGSGLGLAIARAIVEAHGGTIGVDSEEGVGSTFTVTLPVDPALAEAA